MRRLVAVVLGIAGFVAVGATGARGEISTTDTLAVAPVEDGALAFLRRLELQNKGTKTLTAKFEQVRVDPTFDDKVQSDGQFWYRAPNSFHAAYQSEHSSQIWMDGKRYVEYIPSMKQVDIIPMEQGEDAPISQLLLGFGLEVSRIQSLFRVTGLEPSAPGRTTIRFDSMDLDRTMNYGWIIVHFDTESMQPRVIELFEDEETTVRLELKEVEVNPTLKDSLFALPTWPADVDVTDQTKL
jgi:outer membrane lipoprotein-sorting protein